MDGSGKNPASRRQATPVELAALLMDAVCVPSPREREALGELAEYLEVELECLQLELLFLRAFALDFALAVGLGDTPEREAILAQYYLHWERIAQRSDQRLVEDLKERLGRYGDVAVGPVPDPRGLSSQIGQTFARSCGAGDQASGELALLGGRMFGAFFEEITDLVGNVEIDLLD